MLSIRRPSLYRVIAFVVLLACTAIALLGWKVIDDQAKERHLVRDEMQLQSLSLGAVFETALEAAGQTLSDIGDRVEDNAAHPGLPLDLRRSLLRAPSLADLRVYNAQGELTERAGLAPLPDNHLPAWVVADVSRGRSSGLGRDADSLSMFRIARGRQGEVLATVLATLRVDYLQSVATVQQGANLRASFLLDAQGVPILDMGFVSYEGGMPGLLALLQRVQVAHGVSATGYLEMDDSLLMVQQLRSHSVRLVQVASRDSAFDHWRNEAYQSGVMALLIALSAVLFIRQFQRTAHLNQQLVSELHRMNLVIEQSPVPIVITDLQANVAYANPAFANSSGYPVLEILGQNPRKLQSGKTDDDTYRQLWASLTQGVSWRGMLCNRRKDGSEFWEESFIAPLRDMHGAITHYFAVKIDVSARKVAEDHLLQTQDHLQASHDLLDRLSQNVPGVLFQYRLDAQGRAGFPYASDGIGEIFEVDPRDIVSDAATVFARVHRRDAKAVLRSIHDSADKLTPWHMEFRVCLPVRGIRWLSGLANPERQEDGSMLWHGFIMDVTQRKHLEQIAQDRSRDMNTILENSSVGITFIKERHQIWSNQRLAEMFGYALSEIVNQSTRMFYVSAADFDALGQEGYAEIASGGRYISERKMQHRQGHTVWMRLSGKAVDRQQLDAGSIWVFEDISAQKRSEATLQLAASVFTHAREGILITDVSGAVVDVNSTFCQITGFSREEVLGQNPRILHSGRQSAEFYANMWQHLLDQDHWFGEIWNRRKNGEVFAAMETISTVRDAAGQIQNYVALFNDITPAKEHEQALERIAHYDPLTQLPNRILLADRLGQAIAQSQRRKHSVAVVFMDLDGFKAVNDVHGHAVGDKLLIELSHRIKDALRDGDTLARIGGDEFVAVLADLEQVQSSEPVLRRMLVAAANPVQLGGVVVQVSASMGVTLFPQDGGDADLLIRRADQAMYAAKQAGKNRFHMFDVAQDTVVKTHRETQERVEMALERHEFVLYYQPKVHIRTGRVVGAEALIRWRHPERGLLLPEEFLPTVVDVPGLVQLGEWVIASALEQMHVWQLQGLNLPVSVNVAARHLQAESFVQRLQVLLAEQPAVAPSALQMEILETNALQDLVKVAQIMDACIAMGVSFALDDFGTGYSSLTYLKHLPVRTLKIDQSFVRGILLNHNDLAIVNGVIGLSRAFEREVIAEGVETLAHASVLMAAGCELAQGYGISHPMLAVELADWVRRWHANTCWQA